MKEPQLHPTIKMNLASIGLSKKVRTVSFRTYHVPKQAKLVCRVRSPSGVALLRRSGTGRDWEGTWTPVTLCCSIWVLVTPVCSLGFTRMIWSPSYRYFKLHLKAFKSCSLTTITTRTTVHTEVLLNVPVSTFRFPGAKLLFLGHVHIFHFLSSLEFQNDFWFYCFLDAANVVILASVYSAQT